MIKRALCLAYDEIDNMDDLVNLVSMDVFDTFHEMSELRFSPPFGFYVLMLLPIYLLFRVPFIVLKFALLAVSGFQIYKWQIADIIKEQNDITNAMMHMFEMRPVYTLL